MCLIHTIEIMKESNDILPADPIAAFIAAHTNLPEPKEDPENSENPESSENSENLENSENSENSENLENSETSGNSEAFENSESSESSDDFASLGVEPRLLRAIGEMGFEHPMPIQRMVIPHLLTREGDVVGLAQTGTGKTAAFGLPLLQRVDTSLNAPQALIIAPTRELCLQIAGDLADFSRYIDDLRVLPVYGGSSIESQIRSLRKGVQVIVATPGRLIDLIKRGVVTLGDVHTVILDEADEMLNMGFVDSINQILEHVLMFSATMPKEIAGIAKRFMHDPVEFVAGNRNEGTKNVRHIYYMVKAHDKYLALKRVVDNSPDIYGIVFCRTKKETQEVADKLIADGYNADCLDVDDLTHVINYGLPDDVAVYTHRSGRTGRANKTGVSVSIIHGRERHKIRQIEKILGREFEYRKVPTPDHIIEKQLYSLADRLERVEVNEQEISKYLPGVRKKLEWLSEEDLLKRVLSLEFNRLLSYYQDMPDIDLDAKADDKKGKKERSERSDNGKRERGEKGKREKDDRDEGFDVKLRVNIGKASGFFPGNLMELINRNVAGPKPAIGHIDLAPGHTTFDVREADARRILDALRHAEFFGDKIHATLASDGDTSETFPSEGKRGRKRQPVADREPRKKKDVKEKKPKKEKKDKDKKAKYHGNYDIFKKK